MFSETISESIISDQEPRGHRPGGGVAGGADFEVPHEQVDILAEQSILNRDFATRVIDNLSQRCGDIVTLEDPETNTHSELPRLPLIGQLVEQIAFGTTAMGGGLAIGNALEAFQNGDNNTALRLGVVGIVALSVFADLLKDSRQRKLATLQPF